MNELALFAGAGGGILGGKLLGWRTVCAVELDAYAATVLAQRQNDGFLEAFPIWSDIRTFDGRPWRGIVDVVSGGFPCQDISAAGKGAGIDGERSGLWMDMARVIREVRPRRVLVENSPIRREKLAAKGTNGNGFGLTVGQAAQMWATPCTPNGGRSNRPEDIASNGLRPDGRKVQVSLESQARSWQTPRANDSEKRGDFNAMDKRNGLAGEAKAWGTPTARDHKDSGDCSNVPDNGLLGRMVKSWSGMTDQPGSLSPEFHLWLMGWPEGWNALEPLEMDKYRSWLRSLGAY